MSQDKIPGKKRRVRAQLKKLHEFRLELSKLANNLRRGGLSEDDIRHVDYSLEYLTQLQTQVYMLNMGFRMRRREAKGER